VNCSHAAHGPGDAPLGRGVDRQTGRHDDSAMDSPNQPRGSLPEIAFEARLQALRDLKRELQFLHARLEYIRLMLKLGARLR